MLYEKKLYLKQQMLSINLPLTSYLTSYIIMSFFFSLYNSICITSLGLYIFSFKLFTNLSFNLIFWYFFSCNFAFNGLAFLIVALSDKAETGYSLSYSFLLIAFVF
jgi:hypothetical protein